MPDHPKHTSAEAEAELVRRYKQQRPLQRPPTHAGHLAAYLAAVECGVAAVAMAARAGLAARGIACSFTLLHALAGVAAFVLLAKPTLRLDIRLPALRPGKRAQAVHLHAIVLGIRPHGVGQVQHGQGPAPHLHPAHPHLPQRQVRDRLPLKASGQAGRPEKRKHTQHTRLSMTGSRQRKEKILWDYSTDNAPTAPPSTGKVPNAGA